MFSRSLGKDQRERHFRLGLEHVRRVVGPRPSAVPSTGVRGSIVSIRTKRYSATMMLMNPAWY
jgi:hypothetical protein